MFSSMARASRGSLICSRSIRCFSCTASFRTHYDTLGIQKTATPKEIKAAYFDLSKKYHPDVNQEDDNAQEMFVKITEAYSVLSNKENRAKYNETISPSDPHAHHPRVVYRKHWSGHESDRPMNDPAYVHERVMQGKRASEREKVLTAVLIVLVAGCITSLAVYIKIGMAKGKWSKSQGEHAHDQFEKMQTKYELARLSKRG